MLKKFDEQQLEKMATEIVDVLKKWPISFNVAIAVLHKAERQIGEIKINNPLAQDINKQTYQQSQL